MLPNTLTHSACYTTRTHNPPFTRVHTHMHFISSSPPSHMHPVCCPHRSPQTRWQRNRNVCSPSPVVRPSRGWDAYSEGSREAPPCRILPLGLLLWFSMPPPSSHICLSSSAFLPTLFTYVNVVISTPGGPLVTQHPQRFLNEGTGSRCMWGMGCCYLIQDTLHIHLCLTQHLPPL